MIRLATLCHTEPAFPLPNLAALQQSGPLDILCCQFSQQEGGPAQPYLHNLAASLQMTCSATLLAAQDKNKASQQGTVLSILTGASAWVLNSGSIALSPAAQEKERVQFALVRKGSAAVLVAHIRQDAPRRQRLALMQALFNHQLVKGQRHSAVILCTQRHLRLSRAEAAQLLAGTGFMLHSNLQHDMQGAGAMLFCVARESGLAGLELGAQESCLLTQCPSRDAEAESTALICEFQVQARVAGQLRKKAHYPLSFAEQWAGYKEHFRPSTF